jgi:hypothetical protein
MFAEMVGRAVDEGVDYLIGETYYFAKEALRLNIKYQGVCCCAAPMLIPEVAKAMGRKPPTQPVFGKDVHAFHLW